MADETPSGACPKPTELRDFALGRFPIGSGRVAAHLQHGCTACEAVIAQLAEAMDGRPLPAAAEPVVPFGLGRALARARLGGPEPSRARNEVLAAWEALAAGLPRPPADLASEAHRRATVEICLDKVREAPSAPGALELARIAYGVALALDDGAHRPGELADLRAETAAELANALRIKGNLPDAVGFMAEALRHIGEGTGAMPLRARVSDLLGSLERDRRHFPEAVAALERASALHLPSGATSHAARTFVNLATVHLIACAPECALEALGAAVPLIDRRDEALLANLFHNLVLVYLDLEEFGEAASILSAASDLILAHAPPNERIRLRGIEARLARALGDRSRAELLFRDVREDFLEAGLGYDAALVGLELSALLVEAGRPAEVVLIVGEILVTFRDLGVAREALGSLLLLREALEAGRATVELVEAALMVLKSATPAAGVGGEG